MVNNQILRIFFSFGLILFGTDAFLCPSFPKEGFIYQNNVLFVEKSSGLSTNLFSAVRLEDMNVPESHRSLHEYLYDGEDEHELKKGTNVKRNEFDGKINFNVEEWLKEQDAETEIKIAGVYSVSDIANNVQYIGYSRNIALSLRNHLHMFGGGVVNKIKVKSFKFPKKEQLILLQSEWINSLGFVPSGNIDNNEASKGWESTSRSSGPSMTPQERKKYSETKMKLRKAMADATLIDEQDDFIMTNETQRANLRAAVEDDNWSAIIAEQSADTINTNNGLNKNIMQAREKENDEEIEEEDMDAEDEEDRNIDILSPFEEGEATSPPLQGPTNRPDLELTLENVDHVLDEVRPYLIADGGNIEVVSVDVDKRAIYLRLQGACGSCPSSTVTMKMGVERVLREKFSNLTTIEALAPLVEDELEGLSDEERIKKLTVSVTQKLEEVMPAIRGLGADSKINNIDSNGVISLAYKGPDKVKLGIVYALKSIEGVNDVVTTEM